MIGCAGETGRWRTNDGGAMARYSGETGLLKVNDDGGMSHVGVCCWIIESE